MLWNLDTGWLLMAVAAVCIIAFIFGTALDAIMRDDGFGPTGNMVVFATGFFTAILALNSYGVPLRDLTVANATGLAGAFLSISILAVMKAALQRF